MMPALNRRRLLLTGAVLALTLLAVGLLARVALTRMAIGTLLQMAGASEVKFNVVQASPWRVVVEEVGFHVRTQAFAAKRVTFARAHWWTLSLGAVRVEQARLPVNIDGSDTNPSAWATYQNGTAAIQPMSVPLEEVAVDGQLVVQAAALPDQVLTVKIAAHLTPQKTWEMKATAEGPGLALKAEGNLNPANLDLDFKLPGISLDLKLWQGFVQRLVLLPGGAWDMAGKLTGSAAGKLAGRKLVLGGPVRLREGRVRYEPKDVTAEGIEADLDFIDLDKFVTKPGTLRVRELRVGQLALRDLAGDFAFADANQLVVSRLSLNVLGGSAAAEPFKYFLNLRELEAVVLVEGVDVREVMALTQDLPAQATGRVNGRFPLRIDGSGLRLGTGWLELKPGVYAEIQFKAAGLLTSGVAVGSPSYTVLNRIESGLLKLKVSELRLDIRPPNAPPGRSAQLHVVGEPVDPGVKAPVTLDLNVNGPLEKLINLGLGSNVSLGPKK